MRNKTRIRKKSDKFRHAVKNVTWWTFIRNIWTLAIFDKVLVTAASNGISALGAVALPGLGHNCTRATSGRAA